MLDPRRTIINKVHRNSKHLFIFSDAEAETLTGKLRKIQMQVTACQVRVQVQLDLRMDQNCVTSSFLIGLVIRALNIAKLIVIKTINFNNRLIFHYV